MGVSARTRAVQVLPISATQGATTMVVWTEESGGGGYAHTVWARLQGNIQLDHGDLLTPDDSAGARLAPFHGGFLYMGAHGTNAFFDGTSWTQPTGFSGQAAVSGDNAIALNGQVATIFDGTTVSAPTTLTTYDFDALASDGRGGFAVVSHDSSVSFTDPPVHFIAFDGSHWGADSVVYTPTSSLGVNHLDVGFDGTAWHVLWVESGTAADATQGAGSWTIAALPAAEALTVHGAPGALLVAGSAASSAWVARRGASGWVTTQVATGIGSDTLALVPFGSGELLLYGYTRINAAVIDGSGNVTLTPLDDAEALAGGVTVAVNGGALTVGFAVTIVDSNLNQLQVTRAATYAGGSWSAPRALTTTDVSATVAAAPLTTSGFLVFYPEQDTLKASQVNAGVWTAMPPLTQTPSSGAVQDVALARGADGTQLAVWSQWDLYELDVFASQRHGGAWSTPTRVAAGAGSPSVAAGPNGFVIGWTDTAGDAMHLASWDQGTLGAPFGLGSEMYSTTWAVQVVSDGTRYAAIWEGGSYGSSGVTYDLEAVTSIDGSTWSAKVTVASNIGGLAAAAGGPGGIAAIVAGSGAGQSTVYALTASGWTAQAALTGKSNCALSVASTTLLAACSTQTQTDAALFDGSTFTKVPAGIQAQFVLGNDGTDYRIEYRTQPARFMVLHAGAWSALTDELQIDPLLSGLVGRSGRWSIIYAGDPSDLYGLFRSDTAGSSTFPFGQPFDPAGVYQDAPLYLDTAGVFDAA